MPDYLQSMLDLQIQQPSQPVVPQWVARQIQIRLQKECSNIY
jgi:hypothetical protein